MKNENTKTVSTTITEEEYDALKTYARSLDRPVRGAVRLAIRSALEVEKSRLITLNNPNPYDDVLF